MFRAVTGVGSPEDDRGQIAVLRAGSRRARQGRGGLRRTALHSSRAASARDDRLLRELSHESGALYAAARVRSERARRADMGG